MFLNCLLCFFLSLSCLGAASTSSNVLVPASGNYIPSAFPVNETYLENTVERSFEYCQSCYLKIPSPDDFAIFLKGCLEKALFNDQTDYSNIPS